MTSQLVALRFGGADLPAEVERLIEPSGAKENTK
jgi:hypothetical protein